MATNSRVSLRLASAAAAFVIGAAVVVPGVAAAAQLPGAAPAAGPPANAGTSPYVIGRGDELSIKVFGRPELDDTVVVRTDGRISAVLLGEIDAVGTTPEQLDAALAARYGKYFREPQVTVIVRHTAALRVFVGGEVGQPGVVTLSGELSAIAAVYQVGGFRRTARIDSVMLLRNAHQTAPRVVRLNLKDVAGRDASLMLQPQDVLYVPASRIARVDTFVDQYMRQLLPISLTAGFSYLAGNGTFFGLK